MRRQIFSGERRARLAEVLLPLGRVTALAQHDDLLTAGTVSRLIGRWVLELLEVVCIGPVPDVHLCFCDLVSASRTLSPAAGVFFGVVEPTERVAAMVPGATIGRIREQHVFVFVIADPLSAALGLGQLARLAAEAASGSTGDLGWPTGARFSSLRHDGMFLP